MQTDQTRITVRQLRLAMEYLQHLYCIMEGGTPNPKADLKEPDHQGYFGADPRVIKMLYVPVYEGVGLDSLCWHCYVFRLFSASNVQNFLQWMTVSEETELSLKGTVETLTINFRADGRCSASEERKFLELRLQLHNALLTFFRAIVSGEIAESDLRKPRPA